MRNNRINGEKKGCMENAGTWPCKATVPAVRESTWAVPVPDFFTGSAGGAYMKVS